MKNKEIEKLLNNFQEVLDNPKYTDEMYNGKLIEFDKTYDLEQDEIKLLLSYIEQLENNRDKAIKILGNYKHYSTPTEEQNRENEEIVDNAYNILKGDSDE